MNLDELVEKYRTSSGSMTEREKAETERTIWKAYLAREDHTPAGPGARREYLKSVLGVDAYRLDIRQSLLAFGVAAAPLWERLDNKKLLLSSARTILHNARIISDSGTTLSEALSTALSNYDNLPLVKYIDGIPSRYGHPRPRRSEHIAKTAEAKLWSDIRKQVMAYLDERTPNLDPIVKKKFSSETTVALRVVLDEFRNKLRRLVTHNDAVAGTNALLKRDEVDRACQIFGVHTPKYGLPVDLEKANKVKKAQARSLHPDLHGGDEKYVEQYQEVMAAYEVLEKYNSQIKPIGEEAQHAHADRSDRRRHRDQ